MPQTRKAHKVNADQMDRTKMGVLKPIASRSVPEVEGQQGHAGIFGTSCPYCGQMLAEDRSSVHYEWFTCGACGGAFQA